ncbi:aminodeoxychorismate/anthranilate synthase component II [Enterococcus saccharolyticus]|uniref:Glutamine amidotransferase domain-containing protein n=1 Tax=Enterococcus saccharolyticus subsp. saccharolyticus ATCC 43076 TaxID=1139996 RepID=S0JMF3_9ENTE|nr:aminodeoxychorismate/anthranilate synthase component II [Enterococcus saccharolyticus]EOT29043.1 hypothetical protein OMQ_01565 [Enterococcus saccharolyticus subsp. saccharolyticus ATCC 43076]EOT81409.1 hypothetical protein I572_01944 [Enterococcus saccharolyticus subsp. saccharolyticus ATCC 43076]
MILLVDNYDSFTHNLAHQFHTELVILRNDDPNLMETAQKASAIVFSPGPGRPNEAGLMEEVIRRFYKEKPMLGICLGHQALGEVFGGKISIASKIMHGKVSQLKHEQQGLFRDVTLDTDIMRYHSLIIEPDTLPDVFEIYGYADDEIMAIKHKEYPVYGLQFHPESIGTTEGQTMIDTFLESVEDN